MSLSGGIYERLTQSGVFWWDASAKKEFEVSDNFREFLGLKQNAFGLKTLVLFVDREAVGVFYRKAYAGEKEWRTVFRIDGRDCVLRIVRLSGYNDPDGVHHSMGTAVVDAPAGGVPLRSGGDADPATVSFFDNQVFSNSSFQDQSQVSVYDLVADMLRAFRVHFASDVVASAWKITGRPAEFLCIANAGGFATAERRDLLKPGARAVSHIMEQVVGSFGVHVIDNFDELAKTYPSEIKGIRAAGCQEVMTCAVRALGSGLPRGFVSCCSASARGWTLEEKQRIQLLADSLSVLMAQSDAYGKMRHQLVLTRLACEAGGFYTWQWDVKAHKRYVLMPDGSLELASYELLSHRNDYARLANAYCDVAAGKTKGFKLRLRLRTQAEGQMMWFDVSTRVVEAEADGQAKIIVGVAKNVDEEVAQEAERHKVRQFQNSIYNRIPAVIAFCDTQGRQQYINERSVEVFGLRHSVDHLDINIFDSPIFSDEQKMSIRMHDSCDFNVQYDFKKVTAAGYYRTFRTDVVEMNVRVSKLYSGGAMTGYLLVFTDTSMLVVQRRRLQLFNNFFAEIGRFSKLGVCQMGPGGFASAQWNANLGQPVGTLEQGPGLASAGMEPADLEAVNKNLALVADGRLPAFHRDVKVHLPDGVHIIDLHFSYSRTVEAITAISTDITESREREKTIIRALRKAEQVESLRARFFGNISHEIRTPLNAIVGFSSLIAQMQADGPVARYAQIIKTNNEQLLNLVDGIMELSQLQSGNRRIAKQMTEVDDILSDVHDRMAGSERDGVQFLVSHEASMRGLRAPLDKLAVEQILCKLLSNAFQYTDSGCVMIWAQVEVPNIVFHVSDTGCGIQRDKLECIFDVFVKLNPFRSGAGLGLPICRGLARQMGGDVFAESTVGQGSHFWLSLPLFAEAGEDMLTNGSRKNVAVLTQAEGLTTAVSMILPECNVFRTDRLDMSKVWMDNRPLLSIIDVRACPDVVVKFVGNMRSFGSDYKIVVINTQDSGVDDDELRAAGADAVATAPLTSASLSATLASVLPPDVSVRPGDGKIAS